METQGDCYRLTGPSGNEHSLYGSHLIERVTHDIGHWDVYSTIKLKSWSKGHVAVIGDAAHAQPPNLGQGADMAMQNALALAYFLSRTNARDAIPTALAQWEESERPIVEHCQKWSVLYGEVIYPPEALRRQTFRSAFTDPWISAQFFKPASHVPTGSSGFFCHLRPRPQPCRGLASLLQNVSATTKLDPKSLCPPLRLIMQQSVALRSPLGRPSR